MYFTAPVRMQNYTRQMERISRTLIINNGCKKQVEEAAPHSEAIDKGVQSIRGVGKLSHDAGVCHRRDKAPIEVDHDVLQELLRSRRDAWLV